MDLVSAKKHIETSILIFYRIRFFPIETTPKTISALLDES